jgi:hypothetical protein
LAVGFDDPIFVPEVCTIADEVLADTVQRKLSTPAANADKTTITALLNEGLRRRLISLSSLQVIIDRD